ncbi:MAG: serpin family protein [Clostridia bacterium]|nr:serpin family protein [Clostridia bacterium]
MKRTLKCFFAAALAVVVAMTFVGCGVFGASGESGGREPTKTTINLMSGFSPSTDGGAVLTDEFTKAYNTFAVKLATKLYDGKNLLISPLSIQIALAMTANGAKGDTLGEIEATLFGGQRISTFNGYYKTYIEGLTSGENFKISVADSIWFRDHERLTVKDGFLQKNADFYNADAYKAPFDRTTLADINGWVDRKTDGLIKNILDDITESDVLFLLNATCIDAKWAKVFEAEHTSDETFTDEAGAERAVKMMKGTEYAYLENDFATGFIKYYSGNRYAFAAMLPQKGNTVADTLAQLTGEGLTRYFKNVYGYPTHIKMPKFAVDYDNDIVDALSALGIRDLFSPAAADLTDMAESKAGNCYVDMVKHKTAIKVDELGTKAAAATIVGVRDGAVGPEQNTKYVYLDRPFIYFILDTLTDTPIFIGTYR